jgi:hypothetical protein
MISFREYITANLTSLLPKPLTEAHSVTRPTINVNIDEVGIGGGETG